ncbi:MAG: methyltransferase domain-containing protein [Acidobacteriota bacterium]|nr:methyltransferase domain-containing protein [Acidobacteriota bacterium]MDQ4123044.1 methyltransferase domain-containing protein [Acidobacteriota bacterium]
MQSPQPDQKLLETSAGDFPLNEYRLNLAEQELKILHVAAMLTLEDESRFLLETTNPLPYGVVLWSATIALAHEIGSRAEDFRNTKVLELGAGTGLPGILTASLGARVVQTDKNNLATVLRKRNCELNNIQTIEHRLDDWTNWSDTERYDWILGSDILYGLEMHSHLRRIFETNLAPGGRILLSDPFRSGSLRLLEQLEKDGWAIAISKWSVGKESAPRSIAVFELQPPAL